jgi:prepilin-type N-terminal cleavage/methylation domain-containing protein/prepilin-type processing-associated H-X9-DG protein
LDEKGAIPQVHKQCGLDEAALHDSYALHSGRTTTANAWKPWVRSRTGFTLVEMLIAVAIIALLIGLIVPAVQQVREAAARTSCASNLRQLAMAVHLYADAHRQLPQGCAYPFTASLIPIHRQGVGLSWHTSILPDLDHTALWHLAWQAQQQDPQGHLASHYEVMVQVVPSFLCPAEARQLGHSPNGDVWGLTSYPGVAGTSLHRRDGVFHKNYTVRFPDITDGTSNTLMIGERPPGPNGIYAGWYAEWGVLVCPLTQILPGGRNEWLPFEATDCEISASALRPGQVGNACDIGHYWSLHSGGANFAFADGSVRFLSYAASPLLPALATRAGGEVVVLD